MQLPYFTQTTNIGTEYSHYFGCMKLETYLKDHACQRIDIPNKSHLTSEILCYFLLNHGNLSLSLMLQFRSSSILLPNSMRHKTQYVARAERYNHHLKLPAEVPDNVDNPQQQGGTNGVVTRPTRLPLGLHADDYTVPISERSTRGYRRIKHSSVYVSRLSVSHKTSQ